MFYDMGKSQKSAGDSPDSVNDVAILVTVVAGEALNKIKNTSDEDIVEQCIGTLKNMFPEHVSGNCILKKRTCECLNGMFTIQDVPALIAWKVTQWSKTPHMMMSYSYTAPGASGDHYNVLSQDVNRTVYFAGEVGIQIVIKLWDAWDFSPQATNRFHPQTVTGAFLSGVREACKIIDHDTEAHYKKPTTGHGSK